jgi:serine/threonine protein kinase
MDPKSISKATNNLYIPVREAGNGVCGDIIFCVRTRSAARSPMSDPEAQSPGVVAVKLPRREMSRELIANEINALRRIQSCLGTSSTTTISKHFPALMDCDPIKDGESGWLAVSAVHGFDLERLRVVATEIVQPLSGTHFPRRLTLPAIPEALMLSITKQLTEAMGWLHDVANMSHNDIFGGNVMLDVSATSNKGSSFTMPNVVLIDFDHAYLRGGDFTNGADRSHVYELIYTLDSAGRASSQKTDTLEDVIVPAHLMTWWGSFRNFLVINKDRYLEDKTASFAKFWERFGIEIDHRLENVSDEEQKLVLELIDRVVMKEDRFPSEERIREVLACLEDT